MNALVIAGMIQPLVRRMTSITMSIRATPKKMSQLSGAVLRSVKSSPPWIRYTATATDNSARNQSHHMMRWRKRGATGNTRNPRNSTQAT